ncbi:hypothetical protein [Candidatus Nephthysia bennettiae]|uniref:Uncharacterized protein n=1 Tax=Candidatus Nephthysia bennettiae TaxID=3127016 RepID=A0A934K2L2_9BACT|nr:hypothetical protein [Candidatus Dormibacteraeota bacterium]
MTTLTLTDQVLQKTAELLDGPDVYSVSDAQVLSALKWPPDQEAHLRRLMTQLIEQGNLRGPRSGPLRGDNQIIAVDVLEVTP